jgi:hypothetical protein
MYRFVPARTRIAMKHVWIPACTRRRRATGYVESFAPTGMFGDLDFWLSPWDRCLGM